MVLIKKQTLQLKNKLILKILKKIKPLTNPAAETCLNLLDISQALTTYHF